jgi:hypothetical protein
VSDGLKRSERMGVPTWVMSAEGKEGFYQKVGFRELVGWVSKGPVMVTGRDGVEIEVENPLEVRGIGGGAVLWTY